MPRWHRALPRASSSSGEASPNGYGFSLWRLTIPRGRSVPRTEEAFLKGCGGTKGSDKERGALRHLLREAVHIHSMQRVFPKGNGSECEQIAMRILRRVRCAPKERLMHRAKGRSVIAQLQRRRGHGQPPSVRRPPRVLFRLSRPNPSFRDSRASREILRSAWRALDPCHARVPGSPAQKESRLLAPKGRAAPRPARGGGYQ